MQKTLLTLLLVCGLVASAAAQPTPCPLVDDGFDVGCCATPQPNLPFFPQVMTSAKWACIQSCNLEAEFSMSVALAAPIFVLCDYALISVTATPNAPGGPGWSGLLLAKYSRTWLEAPTPGGPPRQRYRFLVNGDLLPTGTGAVGGIPCPWPAEVFGANAMPLHVVGHIDYICGGPSPTASPWTVRMSLSHLPGCISHAPWSARPLPAAVNHPNRSYHLVAPASFVFAPAPEPMGPIIAEAVRSATLNWPPIPGTVFYQCHGEADVLQGSLQTMLQNCVCSPTLPVIGPWKHQSLQAAVGCLGAAFPFGSIPLPGTVIPTGLVGHTLGFWPSSAATNPNEALTVYFGALQYSDPCNAASLPIHVVSGVGTVGPPGQLFGLGPVALTTGFLDLQSNLRVTSAGLAPVFGEPALATIVWNLNTP